MRRAPIALLAVIATLFLAAPSSNQRYVVEEGTDAYATHKSDPTLVWGQDRTRLRPTVCTANLCTRIVPSNSEPREGLRVGGLDAVRVSVCAWPGNTLAGTGHVDVYYWDPDESDRKGGNGSGWMTNPGASLIVTSTEECEVFPDFAVEASTDGTRVVFRPHDVGQVGTEERPGGGIFLVVKALGLCKAGQCP